MDEVTMMSSFYYLLSGDSYVPSCAIIHMVTGVRAIGLSFRLGKVIWCDCLTFPVVLT